MEHGAAKQRAKGKELSQFELRIANFQFSAFYVASSVTWDRTRKNATIEEVYRRLAKIPGQMSDIVQEQLWGD
jgi:hypothetical protein